MDACLSHSEVQQRGQGIADDRMPVCDWISFHWAAAVPKEDKKLVDFQPICLPIHPILPEDSVAD